MSQGCSGTHSDLLEFSIAKVSEQQRTFSVSDAKRILIDLRIHMPVGDKKILPAIVVDIEKLNSEAEKRNARRSKVRGSAHVRQFPPLFLLKKIIDIFAQI